MLRIDGKLVACLVLLGLPGGASLAQEYTPQQWLERMAAAVQSTNYEGTVLQMQDGQSIALKVMHVVKDGVVHEKVASQEGDGLEIIRRGNEVRRILPDEQSVLIAQWNDRGGQFLDLPSTGVSPGSEYTVFIVREERVAGRKAVRLAIVPHDEYRYSHQLWLDTETGFPLQTQLQGPDGTPIEQLKFADIRLDANINASAITPTTSTEDFRWMAQPQRTISDSVDTPWRSDDLPAGFRAVSTHIESVAGREGEIIHILYSDGLANVSVFIEPAMASNRIARRSRVGASCSYSTRRDGYQVTAVGAVPDATVERIATSMRPQ